MGGWVSLVLDNLAQSACFLPGGGDKVWVNDECKRRMEKLLHSNYNNATKSDMHKQVESCIADLITVLLHNGNGERHPTVGEVMQRGLWQFVTPEKMPHPDDIAVTKSSFVVVEAHDDAVPDAPVFPLLNAKQRTGVYLYTPGCLSRIYPDHGEHEGPLLLTCTACSEHHRTYG